MSAVADGVELVGECVAVQQWCACYSRKTSEHELK